MAEAHIQDLSLANANSRSWSDLPIDILDMIYTRIYAVEQYAFRAVCKSWRPANSLKSQTLQFPFCNSENNTPPYLLFRDNELYQPIYDAHHHMNLLLDKPGSIVNVAKGDWFLMTYNFHEIFFYNPITKAVFQLPKLKYGSYLRSMCFSTPPTSKGWLVIAAKAGFYRETFLYTIKDGEKEWSSFQLNPANIEEQLFAFSHCNAVIHKRLYYFLGEKGQVLVHDPKKHKSHYYQTSKSIQDLKGCGGQKYMFESDGKLFAVFVNCDGSSITVCRWGMRKKEWLVVDDIGNNMVFVSAISTMCAEAVIEGMGNKIYFPIFVGNNGLFYSLSTKKYHTFVGGSYADFNIKGAKRYPDSIWIKLPKSLL